MEVQIEGLRHRFPTRNRASKVIESQLLKFIKVHKALLSPLRYLPSEILQEIFLHYANHRYADGWIRGVQVSTMPWYLGHISHRWRNIALSFPSLWDTIPDISVHQVLLEKVKYRALIYLIQRTGTSRTLKLFINIASSHPIPKNISKCPIIKQIIHDNRAITH